MAHSKMLTLRAGLDGHAVYGRVRWLGVRVRVRVRLVLVLVLLLGYC